MAFHPSQLEAIQHRDGPMLVLAGPGSGKTTVITHRVKYLIEHHQVDPSAILVVTFGWSWGPGQLRNVPFCIFYHIKICVPVSGI